MTGLRLEDVGVGYGRFRAVEDVSLDVRAGEWIGLIGPNGAGKSSLLRAVAGLVRHSGSVSFDDRSGGELSRRERARTVALVPQTPSFAPTMLVAEYLLLGRSPHIAHLATESRHDLEVVAEVAEKLDLRRFLERPLATLSGGELQRTVLGRALAQEAPVLLLDEPTTALDIGHQQQALELVDELRHERCLTVLSATHDLTVAAQFADRLLLLGAGRAVALGPPEAVLTEAAVSEHYGAAVRVIREDDGGIIVVPSRSRENPTKRLRIL